MPIEPIPTFDCYAELGVSTWADRDAIEAAFRALAKQHHPDTAANPALATARMKRLNLARTWLVDPNRRALYDEIRGIGRVPGGDLPRIDSRAAWHEEPPAPAPKLLRSTIAAVAFMVVLVSIVVGAGSFVIAALAMLGAVVVAYLGLVAMREIIRPTRRD